MTSNLTGIFKVIADNTKKKSLATRLRLSRFSFFKLLLDQVPRPVHILDVGGTQAYWEMMGFTNEQDVHITLLNVVPQPVRHTNFSSIVADGRDLTEFKDKEFDVVFSNSVLEHVGTQENQELMANEIRRVGKRYFVQTPNYFYPIEPHFLIPGFQWLPIPVRVFLLRHFKLGWYESEPDFDKAMQDITSIRLLRKGDIEKLFPDAMIHQEKFMGIVKSFIAYGGW